MHTSNILSVLASFTPEEFRAFGKYISSPFFRNNHKRCNRLRKLYSVLKKVLPNFKQGIFEWEKYYRRIFGNSEYSEKRIRDLRAELLQLAQEFLAYRNFRKDKIVERIHLLKELKYRRLDNLFVHNLKLALKDLSDIPALGQEYLYYTYLIGNFSLTCRMKKRIRVGNTAIILDAFINYFLTVALRLYYMMKSEEERFNIKNNCGLLESLLEWLRQQENSINDKPLASLYYNALMLKLTKEKRYYGSLTEIKAKFSGILDEMCITDLYEFVQDYFARNPNTPESVRDNETYNLCIDKTKNELVYKSNLIPDSLYLNIVKSCIKLNKIDVAENITLKYSDKIYPENRISAQNLSGALLHFAKNKFEECLMCLSGINTNNWDYQLDPQSPESNVLLRTGVSYRDFFSFRFLQTFFKKSQAYR